MALAKILSDLKLTKSDGYLLALFFLELTVFLFNLIPFLFCLSPWLATPTILLGWPEI